MTLILASSSPHRSDILRAHKISFTQLSPNIDEDSLSAPSPALLAEELARQKCAAVCATISKSENMSEEDPQAAIVLAADTIVINSHGEMLHKPESEAQARKYLADRSGTHEDLVTGFCVKHAKGTISGNEKTAISYDLIPDRVQEKILASKEWQGVCGGLKIEGIIAPYVAKIIGDYDNIRGLPMNRLAPLLKSLTANVEFEVDAQTKDYTKGYEGENAKILERT